MGGPQTTLGRVLPSKASQSEVSMTARRQPGCPGCFRHPRYPGTAPAARGAVRYRLTWLCHTHLPRSLLRREVRKPAQALAAVPLPSVDGPRTDPPGWHSIWAALSMPPTALVGNDLLRACTALEINHRLRLVSAELTTSSTRGRWGRCWKMCINPTASPRGLQVCSSRQCLGAMNFHRSVSLQSDAEGFTVRGWQLSTAGLMLSGDAPGNGRTHLKAGESPGFFLNSESYWGFTPRTRASTNWPRSLGKQRPAYAMGITTEVWLSLQDLF